MAAILLAGASLVAQRLRIGDYDVKFMLRDGWSIRVRIADATVARDDEYVPAILDRYGHLYRYGTYRRPRVTLDDGRYVGLE